MSQYLIEYMYIDGETKGASEHEHPAASESQPTAQSGHHAEDSLAINDIRFRSAEVVIHDSKVVQIEREEKIRFTIHQSQPSQ